MVEREEEEGGGFEDGGADAAEEEKDNPPAPLTAAVEVTLEDVMAVAGAVAVVVDIIISSFPIDPWRPFR